VRVLHKQRPTDLQKTQTHKIKTRH